MGPRRKRKKGRKEYKKKVKNVESENEMILISGQMYNQSTLYFPTNVLCIAILYTDYIYSVNCQCPYIFQWYARHLYATWWFILSQNKNFHTLSRTIVEWCENSEYEQFSAAYCVGGNCCQFFFADNQLSIISQIKFENKKPQVNKNPLLLLA